MNKYKPKLILIGGYMHSGTTLLHKIITKNPSVLNTFKETKILEFDKSIQNQYVKQNNKIDFLAKLARIKYKRSWVEEIELTNNVIEDYFNFIERLAICNNKNFIIDGTPNNYLLLDKLPKDLGDNYSIILIRRDPRDIISSIKKRVSNIKRSDFDSFKNYIIRRTHEHYSLFLNTLSIKSSFKKIKKLSQHNPNNKLLLDYSNLTLDYTDTIYKVAKFMNVDMNYFPESNNVSNTNSAYDDKSQTIHGIKYISNYKKILSDKEIAFLELVFKKYYKNYKFYKTKKITIFNYYCYILFILKAPYDLIVLIIKRIIRFNSLTKFKEYVSVSFKRLL